MLVDLNLEPTILVFVGKEEVGEISSDSEVPIAVGELEFADSSARARPFRLRGTETKKKGYRQYVNIILAFKGEQLRIEYGCSKCNE